MASKSLPVLVALAVPLAAQWLNYPTPGVPRTPSGLPNLGAQAPRAADGHPDFSGIWEADHNTLCPPTGCWDMLAGPQFFDITAGLKDGLPFQYRRFGPMSGNLNSKPTANLKK